MESHQSHTPSHASRPLDLSRIVRIWNPSPSCLSAGEAEGRDPAGGSKHNRNAPDITGAEARKGEAIWRCTMVKGDTLPRTGVSSVSISEHSTMGSSSRHVKKQNQAGISALAYQT